MSANPEGLKKSSLFHLLIIITLAIGLYSNTLKNGFVYDDEVTIVNNTLIKSLDNLLLLFDKTAYFSRSVETSYRPVVTFTYFIDYALYGLKPWGYHLTNVLLHAINGVLLYFSLNLLLTPHSSRFTSPPFLISLLFVSHPVLTEVVNCISYREDLLAFLFYMTTLNLYLILRQPTSDQRPLATALLYPLSCLIYVLALLSKEMAVTLPLIIFCYEWLYGREKAKLTSRLFNRYTSGYVVITLFYLYLRFYLYHNPKEQIPDWGSVDRLLSIPWLIMNYLKLSLFPIHLSAGYVIASVSSPFSLNFILSIIVIVSIFTIIFRYSSFNKMGYKRFPPLAKGDEGGFGNGFSRQRSILFGTLFFLIALTPVYGLVPIVNPFAERYFYLPLVGFIISTVCITYLISEKLKISHAHGNSYMPIVFLVVSIIFSFSVAKRNTVWKDNYSLWADTVVNVPNSSLAYYNLGNAYYYQGRLGKAIQAYLTALRLRPDYVEAYHNLGNAYYYQGRLGEAIQAYLAALRLRPYLVEAYNNLGMAYRDQGRLDEAIQAYLTALGLKPDYVKAYNNLGLAYLRQGRYDEAINEFTAALKLKPDFKEAYRNLEVAYEEKERRTKY